MKKYKTMTQEEKQLLLTDLCSRLPYGVKVDHFGVLRELLGVIPPSEIVMVGYDINDYEDSVIEDIKPYLRPMSSMTEEEKKEYHEIDGCAYTCPEEYAHVPAADRIDWLNTHHFDHRGLIDKGLALEAPEEMYKDK